MMQEPSHGSTDCPSHPPGCEGQLSFSDIAELDWQMIHAGPWALMQPDPEGREG